MSEFIVNFIKKKATEVQIKGFDVSFELPIESGLVEIGVINGDEKQGTDSLLQVVLITVSKQEFQMYMARAPKNFNEAEILFKLLGI